MYIVRKGIGAEQLDGALALYMVDEAQFLALVAKAPVFGLRVMRVFATRLRTMNARLLDALHAAA